MPRNISKNQEIICISTKNQNNDITQFKMKKCQSLKVLMKCYSNKIGLPREGVRFEFKEFIIEDDNTPEELGMEDGDEITVFP